jgi:Cof subfamily protein (haloacid dehalogenase superfamily)
MDLDGTLLDREDGIHPHDREAIASARARGVIVTIATGRLTSRTHPTARSLQLTAPLICADGGVLACSVTERVLQQRAIPRDVTQRLVRLIAQAGLSSFAFSHEAIHSCQGGVDYYPFVRGWSDRITPHADIHAACDQHLEEGAIMLVGMGPAARVEALQRQLAELALPLEEACFDLGGARVVRLMARGASKGSALQELAKQLRVAPEHVAVIGDWYNDLSMFEVAANAYAMPHAPDAVRASASHVLDAKWSQNGAIAEALRHWASVLG